MGEFVKHLADAIVVNRARKPIYAALTDGRSKRLSTALIWFERGSIPLAAWTDWRAKRFNARGIPIVKDDFVSMERIRAPETPPRYRRRASDAELATLRTLVAGYAADLGRTIAASDFDAAAAASHGALLEIERLEEAWQAHLCMSRHFVESIGLCALNAPRYAAASDGATVPLSRLLLSSQRFGLRFVAGFDRMAQEIHALGAGMLLNDVPDIPFLERWNERAARVNPSNPDGTPGASAPKHVTRP